MHAQFKQSLPPFPKADTKHSNSKSSENHLHQNFADNQNTPHSKQTKKKKTCTPFCIQSNPIPPRQIKSKNKPPSSYRRRKTILHHINIPSPIVTSAGETKATKNKTITTIYKPRDITSVNESPALVPLVAEL